MKNLLRWFAILGIALVCGNTAAFAQITPLGDAYINTSAPTTNYGASTTLLVSGTTETAYIQFNLSSIPSGYTGSNIEKATLKLYVDTVTTAGSFNVDYVNGAWDEHTIDASNAPPPGSAISSSVSLAKSQAHDFVLIDVTSALQAWLNGTEANNGIVLVANGTLNATFDSKESSTQSQPAELDVVFAGSGGGTITGVLTGPGSGLKGGGTSGTLSLSLLTSCAANQVLAWSGSAWGCATAGTGTLTGITAGTGIAVSGGAPSPTVGINTALVPQLNAANTFTANQAVSGNLTATGVVTGSSFQIGSNLFAFGSYPSQNAFLGFAGNTTTTGFDNTASGIGALLANTTGYYNTASGASALNANTTGFENTADGIDALVSNTTGSNNTASGRDALANNTSGGANTASGDSALGSNTTGGGNTGVGFKAGLTMDGSPMTANNNTFVGASALPLSGTLTNATAIGAQAVVGESNALVLGSINGVNGATADTYVGIGTTAPTYKLHVGTINNGLRVEGPPIGGAGKVAISVGGNGDVGVDAPGIINGRFVVKDGGGVGINTASPDANLSVNGSADKPGGGSWGTFSDRRLKTLDGNFSSGLEQVLKINPVRYRYKDENAMGIRDRDEHVGLVAQEVQRVIPEAVTENSKGYLLVNNDPIIWAMLNAIKEQQKEVAALRGQLKKRALREATSELRLSRLENVTPKAARMASTHTQPRTRMLADATQLHSAH